MQSYKTIDVKNLLVVSFFCVAIVYYIFLTPDEILKIVKDEYIFLGVGGFLLLSYLYLKRKLKDLTVISYIPDINKVNLKMTIVFFVLFQGVDYYYEDGFKGMISQWFIYWVFGIIAWLLTNSINLYKNFQFYKYESMSEHRL
ncbi:MAG: hypothetical protein WBG69_04180 [Arcobacteraceae bacterium]